MRVQHILLAGSDATLAYPISQEIMHSLTAAHEGIWNPRGNGLN